ncbi:MAG: shikimate kinase [Planctomycetaceae bacterium]
MQTITLVGYRGTGKSTVGPQLAARLSWDWVDVDQAIEARAGRSIAEIFQVFGESEFRRLESKTLDELLYRSHCVLSAGGGAVLDDSNRARMREAGLVVWLTASVDTILERIGDDLTSSGTRPRLTALSPREEIESTLAHRTPLYDDIASLVVPTDHRSVAAIVDEIVANLPPMMSEDEM